MSYLDGANSEVTINTKLYVTFVNVFGANKDVMIHFLNSILNLQDNNIKKIKYVKSDVINNSFTTTKNENKEKIKKEGKMDILVKTLKLALKNNSVNKEYEHRNGIILVAETENNQLLIIEIQLNIYRFKNEVYMLRKVPYCSSGIISHSLSKGSTYHKLPNLILINLLDYIMFRENEKRHWIFKFREKETNQGEGFENLINVHFIELPKFESERQMIMESKYPWILFLNHPNHPYFRQPDTLKVFKKARCALLLLSCNAQFLNLHFQKEKDRRDYLSFTKEKCKISEKKGFKKGFYIGVKKANVKNTIQLLLNNYKINFIEQSVKLSKKEISIIKEFVDDPNYPIHKLEKRLNFKNNDLLKICEDCNLATEARRVKRRKLN